MQSFLYIKRSDFTFLVIKVNINWIKFHISNPTFLNAKMNVDWIIYLNTNEI